MRGILILTILAGTVALPARADLTWTLDSVTFDDGGTAAGSLTFFSAGGESWSISVSGGSFSNFTYNSSDSTLQFDHGVLQLFGPSSTVFPVGAPGGVLEPRDLVLILSSFSPTSGSTSILIDTVDQSRECFSCFPSRLVTGGSIDVAGSIPSFAVFAAPLGVPEPSGWWLLLPGLVCAAYRRPAKGRWLQSRGAGE